MKIKLSQTILWEYETCGLDYDPYSRFDKVGSYEITEQERSEMIEDCKHQGNIGGDWIDSVGAGVTRAYRALYKQLQNA